MQFPSRLKALRLEKKMTQEELGKKINVTKVSVSGYESGNRSPDTDTLQKIAQVFDVSVDYLLGRTDDSSPSHQSAPDWATSKDKRDLKNWLESPDALFFNGIEFTEEDRAKMLGVAETIFWDARKRNKEDYQKSREKKQP
jgi:transcriptional regulator with XRE-family HTH domain